MDERSDSEGDTLASNDPGAFQNATQTTFDDTSSQGCTDRDPP
jgi:hypothetical protein